MAKSAYMVKFAENDNRLEERTTTRIRAFLDSIEPLVVDLENNHDYVEGQELIEDLAQCCEMEKGRRWGPEECAMVVRFLHWITPIKGRCFCNDNSRINATCGYHSVLIFMEDQLWRIAASERQGKRAA